MSHLDEVPGDARERASLEAVDATLAGEPVDPIHADLAELALLLADERPDIDAEFALALDRAAERRFAPVPAERQSRRPRAARALRGRWWFWTPAAGLGAALIAAVVIVASGGAGSPVRATATSASAPRALRAPSTAPNRASPAASGTSSAGSSSPAAASSSPAAASSASSSSGLPLQPPSNGRKIIQGAQLALSTTQNRVDAVAQEVFDVVGQFRGIVNSSNVTATSGPGGAAQFQLSIPSSNLPQAMASLSTLRYARVASRTDNTRDVNDQYQADVRALGDARARRTSLLKQLANASTQAQINSLTAQIHDAEASISSDEATLRGLNKQINYSQVGLTINGGSVVPVPVQSGGFGIGRAAHDAARVLTVAASIALIGLAALVPLALLSALGWWIVSVTRRRRREHALDLV